MLASSVWQWNWYEIVEGATVSLLFVLVPLGWRIERHHLQIRRHTEHQTMLIEEQHYSTVHDGALHPRVVARAENGQAKTPTLKRK